MDKNDEFFDNEKRRGLRLILSTRFGQVSFLVSVGVSNVECPERMWILWAFIRISYNCQ